MQLLSLNFFMFTVSGVWRPVKWSSRCAKLLYNAFTFYTIVSLYLLVLGQFIDLFFVIDNMDDFTMNSLVFTTIFAVCYKATIMMIRRGAIIDLVQTLSQEPCKPRDADETAIQAKFDEFIRSCTIKYALLAMGSFTTVHAKGVLSIMEGALPHRMWTPYSLNLFPPLLITAIQQIVTMFFATVINVGMETLVFGLFLQTCAQLELFEIRLHKLVINRTAKLVGQHSECFPATSARQSHEEEIISGYIRHHLIIYKYAKTLNSVFNQILFVQFFISIYILCMSVYYLSSHITEREAAFMVIYTICMFLQIYIYCWSGNEVILKSASTGDAVYQTDWPMLSVSEKKDLLMIMKRSTIPIKFTSSFLITLSLESFSGILKTSYSAFNMLQQRV